MTVCVVLADDHPVSSVGMAQAIALIRAHRPDVTVLEMTTELSGPEVAVLVARRPGRDGRPGTLRSDPGRGEVLSGREQRVLELTADGMSSLRVGEALHLSRATVKAHLRGVYRKLGVSERAAAVAVGMRLGLLK